MKKLVKSLLRNCGYPIKRTELPIDKAGSEQRGIGDMKAVLEDVKARGFSPQHILDVGANCGEWSSLASQVFPAATFTLIEPQHEMSEQLTTLCQTLSGARYIRAAAGAEAGTISMTIWPDHKGTSSILTEEESRKSGWETRSVDVIRIDSLYSAVAEKPSLVKLDIQGFELEALKGATGIYDEVEMFILEVSLFRFHQRIPILSDVVAFMSKIGYETYDIAGFLRRPLDAALGQVDLVFAKRNGLLRASSCW